jgi:hypothetical protein
MARYTTKGGESMVALRCPCEQGKELWGELWWAGGQSRWVFFDDRKTGVIWSEQATYCPECGSRLERDTLRSVNSPT